MSGGPVVASRGPVVGRPTRGGGQAEAARRVLDAAAPLFYGRGIRVVSADAVIEAAGVTKTTFYRHFPTKDDLVVAYLTAVSAAEQEQVAAWRAELVDRPGDVLRRYAERLVETARGPGFRGCPFLNAIAEHPDPAHPVHAVAQQHRRWLREVAGDLLQECGVPRPRPTALALVMLRDGAMTLGEDVTPEELAQSLLDAGRAVVASRATP